MTISGDSKGVFVISATPFRDDGALDLESTDRLVDSYLAAGVSGMTILGMMGEAAKLSPEESKTFLERVLARVDHRVPVIAGVSNAGTDNLVRFSRDAIAAGPLPTLRTDEQVIAYFADLHGRLGPDVPVVLQDFPQATGVHLSVTTIERVYEACPTIVIFKHEDCPGLTKLRRLRDNDSGRRRVSILVGNSGLFLPQELGRGADGAMTGFAYPEMMVGVCRLHEGGETARAEDLFDSYLPLVRHDSQPGLGLAIRKEILRRRGMIESAHARAPAPKLTPQDMAELDNLIARMEARLSAAGFPLPPSGGG